MGSDVLSAVFTLFGVVVGGFLTFLAQYIIYRQQEKSEMRKKAIDLKHKQCLALWAKLSDTYRYLFFSGRYSPDKIELDKLGEHIKQLNVAIIKAEPFISRQSFLRLMQVRDAVNLFFGGLETDSVSRSYEEHMNFITNLEEPMRKARDVLREELQLANLDIFQTE